MVIAGCALAGMQAIAIGMRTVHGSIVVVMVGLVINIVDHCCCVSNLYSSKKDPAGVSVDFSIGRYDLDISVPAFEALPAGAR